MKKLFLVLLLSIVLLVFFGLLITASAQFTEPKENDTSTVTIKESQVNDLVKEIETVHCKKIETEIIGQKLSPQVAQKVRNFCKSSHDEKVKSLKTSFVANGDNKQSILVSISNSYACIYQLGLNTNIPNYADLGLTSGSCSWHDTTPIACRNERGVACLWGCTNIDPVLGWHTKYFASRTALESEIGARSYHRVSNNYGGDYRRWLSYGYSYQVFPLSVDSTGRGTWQVEGPEANPEFPNWHAIINGWYLPEIRDWHNTC